MKMTNLSHNKYQMEQNQKLLFENLSQKKYQINLKILDLHF